MKSGDTDRKGSYGNKDNDARGGRPPYKKDGDKKPFSRDDKGGDKPFSRSKAGNDSARGGESGGYKKPFRKSDDSKPYSRDNSSEGGASKPFERNKTRFNSTEGKDGEGYKGKRTFGKSDDRKPFGKSDDRKPFGKSEDRKPYSRATDNGESKPFEKKRPFPKRSEDASGTERQGERPYRSKDDKPFGKSEDGKPYSRDKDSGDGKSFEKKRPFPKRADDGKGQSKSDSPYRKKENKPFERGDREGAKPRIEDKYDKKKDKPSYSNPFRDGGGEDKPARKRVARSDEKRPFKKEGSDQPYTPTERRKVVPPPEAVVEEPKKRRKPKHDDDDDDDYFDEKAAKKAKSDEPEIMPLNKYLAHSGVCSRREAAEVIKDGKVKVNNEVVTEPGYKVQLDDIVSMNEKKLGLQKGMVYILLNKPKDYITTNDDPQGRRTVMDLVEGADAERLFPVGRLDRMTTGLLLITNDGDLTQKMAHPSYNMKKIYQVTLDKPLTKADAEQIVAGVTLDDGVAHVDTLAYLESKNELGLEIHSGKNRIVRRIFESLGYVVEKLDRVMYAGLTKKNVPRGRWRYLTEREIVLLKHFKS